MIYFIQDEATFHIKIGFTDGKPKDRLTALQTGCPSRIVLLASIEGDREKEKSLHARFAAHRVVGEWFNPSPALISFLLQGLVLDAEQVSNATGWSQGWEAGREEFVHEALRIRSPRALIEHLEEMNNDPFIGWNVRDQPFLVIPDENSLSDVEKFLVALHGPAMLLELMESLTK